MRSELSFAAALAPSMIEDGRDSILNILYLLHADKLWEHLSMLGFAQTAQPHPAFGASPEKVIERLIEQKYLSFTIRSDGPESVRMYSRGDALTGDFAEVDGDGIKAHLVSLVVRCWYYLVLIIIDYC
jgi:hypothetical protein